MIRAILILLLVILGIVLGSCRNDNDQKTINHLFMVVREYEQLTRDLKDDLDGCRGVQADTIFITDCVFEWSDTIAVHRLEENYFNGLDTAFNKGGEIQILQFRDRYNRIPITEHFN